MKHSKLAPIKTESYIVGDTLVIKYFYIPPKSIEYIDLTISL